MSRPDPPERDARTMQEAADAYERSRVGGLFFLAVWVLICVTAGQNGVREWLVGALFLALAGARIAVHALTRGAPPERGLAATLAVMIATMASWGSVTAYALVHPDYAATPTVILFATSAFTTAYVHNYPMRLWPAYAGLAAGYGPPFVALLASGHFGAVAIATGVFIHFAYLVLAARRAHFEYHRAIDLEQELRAQRDLFAQRSRIDALTGLGNRGAFNERLAHEIAHARVEGGSLALMIVDVDHFKRVNDDLGHAAGDECLVAIAARLRAAFAAPGQFVARLGGEEFAVLDRAALEPAHVRAESFRAALAQAPLALDGADVPLTVSIGVGALARGDYMDAATLYRRVDSALYRAKREGRNRVVEVGEGGLHDS